MGAGQIRSNDGFPVVLLHPQGQAVAGDGRVVHQNVQAAEFVEYLLEAGFYLFRVGHVHLHCERFTARGDNFFDQRCEFFFTARGNGDFGTSFRKRQRGVATDALRRSRNQRDFILQTKHLIFGAES